MFTHRPPPHVNAFKWNGKFKQQENVKKPRLEFKNCSPWVMLRKLKFSDFGTNVKKKEMSINCSNSKTHIPYH